MMRLPNPTRQGVSYPSTASPVAISTTTDLDRPVLVVPQCSWMAARERSNGEDPFPSIPLRNPVPERTPLRETFTPIEPESVTGIIARRLCDQVGALVTREDQTSADVRALGETMVKGFNELKVVMRLPPMP